MARLHFFALSSLLLFSLSPSLISAQCSGNGVNFTLSTNATACLCYSFFGGSTCSTATNDSYCLGLDGAVPSASSSFWLASVSANVEGTANTLVEAVVQTRSVSTRQYTTFSIGNCDPTSMTALSSTSTGQSTCTDTISGKVPLSTLDSGCGYTINITNINGTNYKKYSGYVSVGYQEQVIPGVNLWRTATENMLLDVYVPLNVTISLNATSNITVYAPYALDSTVTSLAVGNGKSYLGLTYQVSWPYTVNGWFNVLGLAGSPMTPGAMTVNSTVNTCTSPSDYTNNHCRRNLTVQMIHNSACNISGLYQIANVSIGCAAGLPASDCPLQTNELTNVQFSIVSDQFCNDRAPARTINDIVMIEEMRLVDPDNPAKLTNTLTYGDSMILRIRFRGPTLKKANVTRLTNTLTGPGVNHAPTVSMEVLRANGSVAYLYVVHKVNETFVGQANALEPGDAMRFSLSASVLVEFEALARRRRQVEEFQYPQGGISENSDLWGEFTQEEHASTLAGIVLLPSKNQTFRTFENGSPRGPLYMGWGWLMGLWAVFHLNF